MDNENSNNYSANNDTQFNNNGVPNYQPQTATQVQQPNTKFCQHCGARIPINAVICTSCGCQVSQLQQSTPAQPQVINISNNSSANAINNAGVANLKPKDKWVALLLCVFLGWLGIHKFYEGKILLGIIYLCTFGLCGIGWFLDCILILCKPNPYY